MSFVIFSCTHERQFLDSVVSRARRECPPARWTVDSCQSLQCIVEGHRASISYRHFHAVRRPEIAVVWVWCAGRRVDIRKTFDGRDQE